MRQFHFDPFGEPMKASSDLVSDQASAGRGSQIALRLGVGLFWGLVVAIVAARVATFDPDFAHAFSAVASNCLRAVVGV